MLTLLAADGLKPVHGAFGAACLTPLETKIWSWLPEPLTLPSCSCHATHGTGSVPGDGGAAGDRRVLGLLVGVDVQRRDAGRRGPGPRAATCWRRRRSGWRRSASRRRAPRWARTTRPTGRCARRRRSRSTGASASTFGSMFSDGPWVTHWPFLNARTKIRWRVAGLLLERRPRHARAAGGERAADDVRDAGVLVGVDPGGRVVVDLRAVGRQPDDRAGRSGRETSVPTMLTTLARLRIRGFTADLLGPVRRRRSDPTGPLGRRTAGIGISDRRTPGSVASAFRRDGTSERLREHAPVAGRAGRRAEPPVPDRRVARRGCVRISPLGTPTSSVS